MLSSCCVSTPFYWGSSSTFSRPSLRAISNALWGTQEYAGCRPTLTLSLLWHNELSQPRARKVHRLAPRQPLNCCEANTVENGRGKTALLVWEPDGELRSTHNATSWSGVYQRRWRQGWLRPAGRATRPSEPTAVDSRWSRTPDPSKLVKSIWDWVVLNSVPQLDSIPSHEPQRIRAVGSQRNELCKVCHHAHALTEEYGRYHTML